MCRTITILLVGDSPSNQWRQLVAQIVAAKGILDTCSEHSIEALLEQTDYDMVIVDATIVAPIPPLIRRIHAQQPNVRVVVVTAAPTWLQAREAFRAGAFDYAVKSLNRDDLAGLVDLALGTPPPSNR